MAEVVDPIVLEKGLRVEFFKAFAAAPAVYPQVVTEIPSTSNQEKYGWLGNAPQMREFKDERLPKGLLDNDYTLVNKKWESTIGVDVDDLEDDQYGQIKIRINDMAERAKQHVDGLLADVIEAGLSTVCYDGQYFFDTDHSEGSSGTQDNDLTYNATATTALTLAEARAIYVQARVAMRKFKDDQGENFGAGRGRMLVVVCPDFEEPFEQLMSADLIPSAAGTATETNVLKGKFDLLVLNDLLPASTTPAVYIFDIGHYIKSLIFQRRTPLTFKALEGETEAGFLRDVYYYGTRARYNLGYGLWQYGILTTVT